MVKIRNAMSVWVFFLIVFFNFEIELFLQSSQYICEIPTKLYSAKQNLLGSWQVTACRSNIELDHCMNVRVTTDAWYFWKMDYKSCSYQLIWLNKCCVGRIFFVVLMSTSVSENLTAFIMWVILSKFENYY